MTLVDFFQFTVVGQTLFNILWFFIIFCVAGVLVEMLYTFALSGVIESRSGLLYLPLSPIYGLGGVFLGVFLWPYLQQPFLLFLVAMILGSVLEYVGSWVMEKFFHAVFWDYSSKPFNLNGRICLEYSIFWGFLGGILMYVIVPPIQRLIDSFSRPLADQILVVVSVLTLLSIVLTLSAFSAYARATTALLAARNGGEVAPKSGFDRLIFKLVPENVMINTFPRMSSMLDYQQLTGHYRQWIQVGPKETAAGKSKGLQLTVTTGPEPPHQAFTDTSPKSSISQTPST